MVKGSHKEICNKLIQITVTKYAITFLHILYPS